MGDLRIQLRKAVGLNSVDLNGKSDPYVVVASGEQSGTSGIKTKTLNPAWHEEIVLRGTLLEFVTRGLTLTLYDADAAVPRPDKDDTLGEVSVSLDVLRRRDAHEFSEPVSVKGTLIFAVVWEPPPDAEEAVGGLRVGDVLLRIDGAVPSQEEGGAVALLLAKSGAIALQVARSTAQGHDGSVASRRAR